MDVKNQKSDNTPNKNSKNIQFKLFKGYSSIARLPMLILSSLLFLGVDVNSVALSATIFLGIWRRGDGLARAEEGFGEESARASVFFF